MHKDIFLCDEDNTKTALQSGDLLIIEVNHGLLSIDRDSRRIYFRQGELRDDKMLLPYLAHPILANEMIGIFAAFAGVKIKRERAEDPKYVRWRVL